MTSKSQLKASVAAPRAPESLARNEAAPPKTLTIPEAGWIYFGLSKNGSYDAAERGEIPFIRVGRLKSVSVAKMEQIMADGVGPVVSPAADRDAGQAGQVARQAVEIPAFNRHAAPRPSARICRLSLSPERARTPAGAARRAFSAAKERPASLRRSRP